MSIFNLGFIFGLKPKPGTYHHWDNRNLQITILDGDIHTKHVTIRYKNLDDTIMSFREFHFCYGKL